MSDYKGSTERVVEFYKQYFKKMTKEENNNNLIKLSLEVFKVEPSAELIIVGKDNDFIMLHINYLNPKIFQWVEELDYRVVNITPHNTKNKLLVTIQKH